MITTLRLLPVRIGLLIAAHLLLGLIMAVVALSYLGFDWPGWVQIWFLGLVGSEMLLLGIWAGFATIPWWLKFIGMVAGNAWLTAVSLSTYPPETMQSVLEMMGFIVPPVLVVAFACLLCRYWLARVERRSRWVLRPVSEDLQFTLKSLIILTVAVSVLLALGRMVRAIDEGRGGAVMTVVVFSLIALLSGALLIWASLGPGRIAIRVPTALVGMAAVGLIFPYYLGGPPWRFFAWPALTLVISAYVVASLLVIRSCGYRLVPVWQHEPLQ